MLKKIIFGITALGIATSFIGCGDDEKDERGTPDIWNVVDTMWNELAKMNKCSDVYAYVTYTYSKDQKFVEAALQKACDDYESSRGDRKGGADALAYDLTNSGYYQAAYILMSDIMKNNVNMCVTGEGGRLTATELKSKVETTFSEAGCTNFLSDAATFVKNRGDRQ